ncbi:MAG: BTAD domain-containing putative transcriptional regulator [Actinomycetota bacterium]
MIRIYLTGRMVIEGSAVVDEPDLPGSQGRVLLAALASSRGPVSRARLADILWEGDAPAGADRSLNPLLSKLRRALMAAGCDRGVLSSGSGAVELRRSADLWIDTEEATAALDGAEGALRREDPHGAWPRAAVATSILRRPFLEGVELAWVQQRRRLLHERHIRALEVACEVWIRLDDPGQAVVAARQLVEADPFRETSHARLIRAHRLAGNRAEALLAFSECARLLRDELGVEPSSPVQEAYEEALGAT